MSLNYTTVRLWWNGERGQAQCDGIERELRQVPTVEGVDIDQIDYAPELRCFLIKRKPYTGPADMEPPEIEAVKRWLHCFANAVKRELGMRS